VIPLFGSPSKPWNNPHIEGHNRVFNEKVWRKNFFTSLEQIDQETQRFNHESLELFNHKYAPSFLKKQYRRLDPHSTLSTDSLRTRKNKKIYFVRFVESPENQHSSQITIMNEHVVLPEQYNHQFVFTEWNLEHEQLSIYSEYKCTLTLIQKIPFKLNQ
jgi:hypothetical protein